MGGAAGREAVNGHLEMFAANAAPTFTMVGQDGKIKMPKRKKVLGPEEKAEKELTGTLKKPLG